MKSIVSFLVLASLLVCTTVASAAPLTLTRVDGYSSSATSPEYVVAGAVDVLLGAFNINTTTNTDVVVTNVLVFPMGPRGFVGVGNNLGREILVSSNVNSSTHHLDRLDRWPCLKANLQLHPSSTTRVEIHGDIGYNIPNATNFQIGLAVFGRTSRGRVVMATASGGVLQIVEAGSLGVSISGNTPKSQLMIAGQEHRVLVARLTARNDNMMGQEFTLGVYDVNGNPSPEAANRINTVSIALSNGLVIETEVVHSDGKVVFDLGGVNGIVVPKNSDVQVQFLIGLNPLAQLDQSGWEFKLGLEKIDGISISNSTVVLATFPNGPAVSNTMKVVNAYPSVTYLPANSFLAPGKRNLINFRLGGSYGPTTQYRVTADITEYNGAILDGNFTIVVNGVSTKGTQVGLSTLVSFDFNTPITIPTLGYIDLSIVGNVLSATSGSAVVTQLLSDGQTMQPSPNFVWSDGTALHNGWRIPGLPVYQALFQ